MKKIGALKWLFELKNGESKGPSKLVGSLRDFDNPLLAKWQSFFANLPPPNAPLEIGSYRVCWNPLLRSRAGLCKPFNNLIELNPHLLTTDDQIENTLVHELCHLSVSRRFWRAQAHGLHWKKLMIYCGFEPKRCHQIEGARVYRQKRWEVICECDRHMVTTRMFNRIQKGVRYSCRSCRKLLITP